MFFPIPDEFATRGDVLAAGNGAVGLYARAGSWSTHQQTYGQVPAHVAAMLGTPEEAAALVANRLWRKVKDGYVFTPWPGLTRAQVDARRAGATDRQRRSRARRRAPETPPPPPPTGHDPVTRDTTEASHRDSRVTIGQGQYQGQTAAAAADPSACDTRPDPAPAGAANPFGLPAEATARVAVDILASRAATAGLVVRWDTLTALEVLEVATLAGTHGDDVLIRAAHATRAAHRTPAASARAWLPTWRALPPPGHTLAAVPDPRCTDHPTETARSCRSCAADRKAATP